jgi:hypothetical protein
MNEFITLNLFYLSPISIQVGEMAAEIIGNHYNLGKFTTMKPVKESNSYTYVAAGLLLAAGVYIYGSKDLKPSFMALLQRQ